ncbi:MAG: NAD(P)H-dependent oxidoreductase subunit E, partial [Desulfobaccales bacterium]
MSRYDGGPADLIPVLQDIQDEFTYLPKDELKVVAQRLNVPLTRIY